MKKVLLATLLILFVPISLVFSQPLPTDSPKLYWLLQEKVVRSDLAGSNIEQVLGISNIAVRSSLAIDPQSRNFYAVSGGDIYVAPLSGGVPMLFVDDPDNSVGSLNIDLVNRDLYYSSGSNQNKVIRRALDSEESVEFKVFSATENRVDHIVPAPAVGKMFLLLQFTGVGMPVLPTGWYEADLATGDNPTPIASTGSDPWFKGDYDQESNSLLLYSEKKIVVLDLDSASSNLLVDVGGLMGISTTTFSTIDRKFYFHVFGTSGAESIRRIDFDGSNETEIVERIVYRNISGNNIVSAFAIFDPDICPEDPQKIEPGVCGCGVADTDTDLDGTFDCSDLCPSDASKTAAGTCGCGVAESDTDSDGTPNCIDQCPADASKITAGVCGCGVVENSADPDSDGSPDCFDNCPSDPAKTEPGSCGCGVADADSNNNQILDCSSDETIFTALQGVQTSVGDLKLGRRATKLEESFRAFKTLADQNNATRLRSGVDQLGRAVARLRFLSKDKSRRRDFRTARNSANQAIDGLFVLLRTTG
jgi:hypothetical protein